MSELFLRPRPFGIVESSYYKDQWLGYDRYLWDKMGIWQDVKFNKLASYDYKINYHLFICSSFVQPG